MDRMELVKALTGLAYHAADGKPLKGFAKKLQALADALDEGNSDDLQQVFEYWFQAARKGANTRFTDGRKTRVRQRLRNYSVEDIKAAIRGCMASEHHSGVNDRNASYNDLELICRSDTHLEKFRDMGANAGASNEGTGEIARLKREYQAAMKEGDNARANEINRQIAERSA